MQYSTKVGGFHLFHFHLAIASTLSVFVYTYFDLFEQQQLSKNSYRYAFFTWAFDETGTAHARNIVTDNGWKMVLDRGLDIFQAPVKREGFTLGDRLQDHRLIKGFYVTFAGLKSDQTNQLSVTS